jgi:hypothetical protein
VDGQVKIRGVRAEPAEIEAVLREHPAVADVVVAATGNGTADRRLAAYVVARPGGAAPAPAALRAHVAERLPAAMVPVAWVRMPSLPLTANGKVARERLPAPTQEHYARAANGNGHRAGPHEAAVIEAFESVLEIRPVTAEDDFFALGATRCWRSRCAPRSSAAPAGASRPPRSSPRPRRARSPPRSAPAACAKAAGTRWSSCAGRARARRCSWSPRATATCSRSPR